MNYGGIVYAKNPLSFAYLEAYMGTDNFDKMMQAYFQKWKFKHPLPNDFFVHLYSNGKDSLQWFEKELLNGTSKQDIAIKGNQKGLKLYNKGNTKLPMPLSLKNGDSTLETLWFKENTNLKWTDFTSWNSLKDLAKDSINVSIELMNAPLDLYPQNNRLFYAKKNKKLEFTPLFNFENNQSNAIFWMPLYRCVYCYCRRYLYC